MIGIARDVASGSAINGDPGIDLVEVAVSTPLAPASLLSAQTGASVFGNFFTLFDRPFGK